MTGAGPEAEALQTQSQQLQLQDQVQFTGPKRGEELGRLMNAHRILVVPSIWAEPFGIVALEGLASGCVVIGSEQGGLKDAIGACGLVFPNGNADALAKALEQVLLGEWTFPEKRVMEQHLHLHSAGAISGAFEGVLYQAAQT
jgi:glycosyltransferase involved in cell wall biosynthesis